MPDSSDRRSYSKKGKNAYGPHHHWNSPHHGQARPEVFWRLKLQPCRLPGRVPVVRNPISGSANTTACCHNKLVQVLRAERREAGGKNCVLCNNTHA